MVQLISPKRFTSPAMFSSTRWRKSWGSTDCKICHVVRPGTENRHRSAKRSDRRHAFGRMEDPQLQAEVVCRRDHFGRHRPGRRGDHSRAVDACHRCISMDGEWLCRTSSIRAACRLGLCLKPGYTDVKNIRSTCWVDNHHRRDGQGVVAGGYGPVGPRPGIDIAGKTDRRNCFARTSRQAS